MNVSTNASLTSNLKIYIANRTDKARRREKGRGKEEGREGAEGGEACRRGREGDPRLTTKEKQLLQRKLHFLAAVCHVFSVIDLHMNE